MTEHKHLKAAVRARMARTGERYTTARRHLVGETSPLPGYPAFGGGRHHDSALLAHVLEAAGVRAAHDGQPLDEPMVAGLAGGIGFMYFSFSYAGSLPTMTIVPRIHPRPFIGGALERAGIAHRVSETTSAVKAARELDAALDAGATPVCTVDRAALPHQVWADVLEGADPYDVAVAGRRGSTLLIDDERLEPIEMDNAEFAAARAAHRKSRHRMVVLDPGAAPVDLVPGIRASLAVTVHDLTEDVMPGNFAGNFGLRGLARWAAAVGDRRSAKGWFRLFDSGPAFGHALRRLHDCLTFDHSSPGAMRPLYADFLTEAAPIVGDAALDDVGERYAAAGAVWAEIADAALAGALAPYRPLVERRLELLLGGGSREDMAALSREVEAFTAGLDVGPEDRAAELDAIADLAARAVRLEEDACAALREAAG
jgi:hypothetical protein